MKQDDYGLGCNAKTLGVDVPVGQVRTLVPGHEMWLNVVPVMRYSSSMNSEYLVEEVELMCSCGWAEILTHKKDNDRRILVLEHLIADLAAKVG